MDNTPQEGIWQEALSLLRQQMPADTFDHLLRGSRLIEASECTWRIGVRPHAVEWLTHRLNRVVERTVSYLTRSEVRLEYVAEAVPPPRALPLEAAHRPGGAPPADETGPQEGPAAEKSSCTQRAPAPPPALASILAFDPNSASGGGFWKMGHYANWFWAAYLGAVAWRVYELVVSGDKRAEKTRWTPPRRYSVSELARAIASGRQGRPNRDQIRGRYRRLAGKRVWRPGAFDRLVEEGVARIEWHAGDSRWRPWRLGGSARSGHSGLRVVYRISVVATLPLLTPRQVACLPAENQVQHERYLAERAPDLLAWEQISLPTLAGLDPETALAEPPGLTPGRQ